MNVTAVSCLAFQWTCPKCGYDYNVCRRDDLGQERQCSHCSMRVMIDRLIFDNGAVMVSRGKAEVG